MADSRRAGNITVDEPTAKSVSDSGVFQTEAVQFLTRALEEQRKCSEMYGREIQVLRKEAKSREWGTANMVAFLQKRMKTIETEHSEISAKLQGFLANESAHIAALDADCAGKVAGIQRQATAQIEELKRRLEESEAQLKALTTFRDERSAIENRLNQLNSEAAARETSFQQQLEHLERQHRTELIRVRQSCLAEIAAVHESSRRTAENDLSEESRQLRVERARLRSELQFHEMQTQRLVEENEKLHKELQRLRRELDLQTEKEQHYAVRGAQQQRRIRELSRKVESAENEAVRQSLNGKKEAEKVQQSIEAELASLRIEAAECRNIATLREKELQHMRRLAGMILSQRTQIERFFQEALRENREQCKKDSKENPARRRTKPEAYSDMEPAERDRILHLMFAKLKGRRPNTTQPPEHSFQITTKTRLPPPYTEPEFQFVTTKDQ